MTHHDSRGVLAPVLTPFDARLGADVGRFVAHCRWLVTRRGAGDLRHQFRSRVAVGRRAARPHRRAARSRHSGGAADARHRRLGAHRCGRADPPRQPRRRRRRADAAAFFYKGVSDDGVFAYYAEVIERVGSGCAPIYLYHIPQVTQVPITLGADRAAAEALSRGDRRRQGLVGRLEQLEGDDRQLRRRRLRRLPGQRGVPVALAADRRRRLHQRDGEHEPGRDPPAVRRLEHARGPGAAGAGRRGAPRSSNRRR